MKSFFIACVLMGLSQPVFAMSNIPSSYDQDRLIGSFAPKFTLENSSGVNQSLEQVSAGKKVVLFFWATWCPHCHGELERVRQRLDTIKQKGIQVVLINAGESREEARAFLKSQNIPLESLVDEDNEVTGLYGVRGLPALFFINEKGVIQSSTHEFPTNYETKF